MLTAQDIPTFSYPKIRYGTAPVITRMFREAAVAFITPMLAERTENRMASGKTEYLFSRIEETARVDMLCEPDELAQLRWFFEDWGSRGKQFEFWIDRWTGSVWMFDDTRRDQNKLTLALSTGSEAYADTVNGRGIVLSTGQYLSVALAQASAGTKTGYDDPLDKAEGEIVVDWKPAFAGGDSTLHVIVDTTGGNNRLQLRKTATNTLVLEITDNAGGVKSVAGSVAWNSGDRVQIVARWDTGGGLALWYAVNGGAFVQLTTAAGAGTGIITTLPATLYIGANNAGASAALGTYDTVAIFKRAFANPLSVLPSYRPMWRNYFAYAELQRAWQPTRVTPGRLIFAWPMLVRQGTA